MTTRISVLTGDVVGSQRIKDKDHFNRTLDAMLDLIEKRFNARCDRYRGDGFQVVIPDPGNSMTAVILIRAALIQQSPSRQNMWDARIAVGVGSGKVPEAERFAQADGEAFVLSGQKLDGLSDTTDRLAIVTSSSELDETLALMTRFVDDILSHWSRFSAEVVSLSLLHDESQQALAQRLGRAQPTINRRLAVARWPLIRDYLAYTASRLAQGV
ncbi:SatD family protein [Halomonas sp. M20]|uniref:SatD family protein n=1 Tax=Halomonas sp. M20 TaxID=2763264 RepID=UPI001D0BBC99|nr:SatD family protein [Halomonas sp. M20]